MGILAHYAAVVEGVDDDDSGETGIKAGAIGRCVSTRELKRKREKDVRILDLRDKCERRLRLYRYGDSDDEFEDDEDPGSAQCEADELGDCVVASFLDRFTIPSELKFVEKATRNEDSLDKGSLQRMRSDRLDEGEEGQRRTQKANITIKDCFDLPTTLARPSDAAMPIHTK